MPAVVTPDGLTLAGFAIGLIIPIASGYQYHRLAMIVWLLNRLLDGLDGTLARVRGRATPWGGYLDLLCDFTVSYN